MLFEQIATGGCQSYLVGCRDTGVAAVIDPEASQVERYATLASRDGVRIAYVIDTHTHADHFSGSRMLAQKVGAPVAMHRAAGSPHVDIRLDDGDLVKVGRLDIEVLHTPGHTPDSICLLMGDRVFTGDTLLIGAVGRTDLPGGDAAALHASLFGKLLELPGGTMVFPGHEHGGRRHSTIAQELAGNPALRARERQAFLDAPHLVSPGAPPHMSGALRANLAGGKSFEQMVAEARSRVPFIAMTRLVHAMVSNDRELVVLDVRERDDYESGHIPGALSLPRGQLELEVDALLPDPTERIVTCCEFGRVSVLAAATLRDMGFQRAVALDGGMEAWRGAGYPMRKGAEA